MHLLAFSAMPAPSEAQLWPRAVFSSLWAEGAIPKGTELSRHQREVYGSGMSDRGMLAILGPCEPCSCCTSTAASPKSHPQGRVRTPSPAGLQSIRHRRGVPERAGGCGVGMRGWDVGGGMRGWDAGWGMRVGGAAIRSLCASLYLPRSPSSLPFPSAAFYAARPRLQGLGIFPGFPSWGLAALILGTSQFCFLAARLRKSACAGRRAWPFPTTAGFFFVSLPGSLPPGAGCSEMPVDINKPLLKAGALAGVQSGDTR